VLYGECGHAYPYVIYGMHVLLNITAGPVGHCVLLRALEPLEGEEIMVSRRGNAARKQLTNGPGKLCRAMGVGMELYGADLCGGGILYGEDREYRAVDIVTGPRIGVDYAGEAAGWPLRFGIAGSPFLSAPFPGIYKNNNRR
jgi:DNA-3-methyladenine glycosylase